MGILSRFKSIYLDKTCTKVLINNIFLTLPIDFSVPKCVRETLGEPSVIRIGNCVSNQTYLRTKCSGYCEGSVIATHGNSVYDSQCTCCTPTKVKKVTVFLNCPGEVEPKKETQFSIIEECACNVRKCTGSEDLSKIKVTDESGEQVEQRRRRKR